MSYQPFQWYAGTPASFTSSSTPETPCWVQVSVGMSWSRNRPASYSTATSQLSSCSAMAAFSSDPSVSSSTGGAAQLMSRLRVRLPQWSIMSLR